MVIYFDVLFFINVIMNFIILWFVAIILNQKKNVYRILLGAIFGSLFLLELISKDFLFLNTFPAKITLSTLMGIISFMPRNIKDFIKIQGFLYLISFMVGGGVLAFFYFFNINRDFFSNIFLLNNISIPWWILLVSSFVLFIFLKFIWPLIYSMLSREKLVVPISIYFGNKSINVEAFIDTGNDLCDPISSYPVIIVEHEVFEHVFPEKLVFIFDSKQNNNITNYPEVLSKSKWANRFRIIPFESIGKSKGLMVGFLPDLVTISYDNKILEVKEVIIGIHSRKLSSDNSYKALLNPDLILK